MPVHPPLLWSLDDWADAVVALPAAGPLPQRTVLVPNERVAHALRRTLVERGQHAVLAGTRFTSLLELARSILANAGEQLTVNETELSPALVRDALAHVELERFKASELRELPGWDQAFAATIRELESACLSPQALLASLDPQVRDVGRIFAVVAQHPERMSAGFLLQRAAALAAREPKAHANSLLAVLTGFELAAELLLLRALPGVTWAVSPVRPVRAHHLAKLRELHGGPLAHAFAQPASAPRDGSALAVLQAQLFGSQGSLPPPTDDSVQVVTYAGVHEEVEAAVGWVVEQILDRGLSAQDIALVSPAADGYASLLSSRLRALPWPADATTTFAERGLPLVDRADGARFLALIRALREGLPRERLADLLPVLKGTDPEQKIPNLSRAWALLNEVGWVGGDRSHLHDGLGWHDAWLGAISRLQPSAPATSGLPEQQVKALAALERELSAHAAAILALTQLLGAIVEEQPLAALWTQLKSYLAQSFRLPPALPPVSALVDEAVERFVAHDFDYLVGVRALDWLEELVVDRLVRSGRYGMPAVYIGSLAGMRGLRFRAVRVLGLAEGALPSAVREDAVLSDAARAVLSPSLPTSRTRSHRQLAAFDQVLRATSERLVLSAPRVGLEGSARQPAAVLLDVMRALGAVPDALESALGRHAGLARRAERRQRHVLAVSSSAQLARVAAGDRQPSEVPRVVSLAALRLITRRDAPTAHDGLLQGVIPRARLPGLTAERPISATRLGTLLSCPHRYLFENVLGWQEATGPLPGHTIHALSFGGLLHDIAEQFWRDNGSALGVRSQDLAHHQAALRELACERFAEFRTGYPFASDDVADAQLQEVCDQLSKLLDYDWHEGRAREFIAVERGFGYDQPCAIQTAAGPLYVRGSIDRLDLEGDMLLVRDLKSGRSKPRRRDAAPEPNIDLQLGLYARVAQQLAGAWQTPSKVGVAYVYLRSGELERRWVGADYVMLETQTDIWLSTALEVLASGAFVRSPNRDDCKFCPHKPSCHAEHVRTERVLEHESVPLRLRELKKGAP